MTDPSKLIGQTNQEFVGKNYRTYSSANGETTVVPFDNSQKVAERLASIGGEVHGKDGRTRSMATKVATDIHAQIAKAKELCAQPMKLSWKNIKFEVEVLQNEQEVAATGQKFRRQMIVKDCSGYASPGVATYIMGSSGAGKTSLLNILSDRVVLINKATLSGTIVFNDDIPVNQDNFARYAAYVMQDDVLFAHFTVTEALTFSARLKLTKPIPEQDRDVARIIAELGLTHVSTSQIGDIRRKILSGGERKRTSIGVELVSDPSLIMLDEPTSGLDSFKARSICKLLHDLARKKGKTIVSTIHSPSSEAFFYFDRLILMADGFTVYQGDAKQSLDFFRELKWQVPKRCNPADFFMKALDIKYPKQADDIEKLEQLNMAYRTKIERIVEADNKLIKLDIPESQALPAYRAPTQTQLYWLMYRSWIYAQREPRIGRAKILQTVIIAVLLVPTFWRLNSWPNPPSSTGSGDACATSSASIGYGNITDFEAGDPDCFQANYSAIQSMCGAIYFLCIMQMMLNFLPTVIVFQGEKPVFVRERAANMYDIWVYATTKMLAEIPIMLLVPLILLVVVYPSIGFQDRLSEFFKFYLILALMVQAATALGYFLSSVFNSETAAVAFSPIINQPLSLLGGYMINLKSIKGVYPQALLEWLQYISPVRYCFNGLMQSQWPLRDVGKMAGQTAIIDMTKMVNDTVGTTFTYGGSVAGLICLWFAFRFFTVVSLALQDRACQTQDSADVRNVELTKKRVIE